VKAVYSKSSPYNRKTTVRAEYRVSVSKVGGKSGRLMRTLNAPTNSCARTVMDTDLTAEQEAEARRIYDALKHSADAELMALASLVAAKDDGDIFGDTE
jgi:tellurite resistance protein